MNTPERHLPGSTVLPSPTARSTALSLDELAHVHPDFIYNKHNELVFDDERLFPSLAPGHPETVKFDEASPELINNATLRALIVQLTSPEVIDYNLICDFFLTYRIFCDSGAVMNLLLTRIVWALQYINSKSPTNVRIGKLVLLRTFVVLRHWLLNYFVDDFDPNSALCDSFVRTLNGITSDSNLINADMIFESKVICDLKVHWISLMNEFWKVGVDVEHIDVLSYALPATQDISSFKKLSKSNTEMLLHTNPSYRRSAMLSLYDQRTQHKCLILDEANANDENPQFSVNNLLLQHSSSRTSLNNKLRDFHDKRPKAPKKLTDSTKANTNNHKHNHMNLQDSSWGLKKMALMEDKENAKEKLSKNNDVGFSTNGHIKLPLTKAQAIVPPTPAKKMDYVIKDEIENSPVGHGTVSMKNSKSFKSFDDFDDEVGRKTSIKKLVDGWKKTFNHSKQPTGLSHSVSSNDIDALIDNAKKVMPEEDVADIAGRMDILSARIVDELEYLIRYYVQLDTIKEGEIEGSYGLHIPHDEFVDVNLEDDKLNEYDSASIAILGSPTKKTRSRENNQPVDEVEEVSELNITKIDNLINSEEDSSGNSKHSSFQQAASLNWNDDGEVNFDNSQPPSHETSGVLETNRSNRLAKAGTQYFDVSSELPIGPSGIPFNDSQPSLSSSISTPSNLTQYDAEITDLGIALSPQRDANLQPRRISFNEAAFNNKRLSTISKNSNGSAFKRDSKQSAKSYVSYDSAFSVSNSAPRMEFDNGHLRKKAGIADLKANINGQRVSLDMPVRIKASSIGSSTSHRRSVRFSTLCALTELPFSAFMDANTKRNSILPDRMSKLSDVADSSIFSVAMKSNKNSVREEKSDGSSGNSVAIPGISNYVLKELAAIPDESFRSNNPIEFALYKLEGKHAGSQVLHLKTKEVLIVQTDEGDEDIHLLKGQIEDGNDFERSPATTNETPVSASDNTQDILNEINNANTLDVVDLSEDVTQEAPLTPIKTNKSPTNPLTSTPNNDNLFFFGSGQTTSPHLFPSPRIILEGYRISSEMLSVERVMEGCGHISFILSHDSVSLAHHFTAIEKDMLQEVDWKELIELKWNTELTPVNSWLEILVNENYYSTNKGVNLVILRFNLMVNWIISEVLLTLSQQERINLISRFIHVAQNCFAMQNFSTLMQIILALTSEKMLKLRETWKNLLPGDILMLKNLEELALPLKNFLNIRLCINQITPSKGCIPFVGLYLSDLIFNAERPKFVKQRPDISQTENTTTSSDSSVEEKLVNFLRFRTSVHIVKSLSQCIEWLLSYELNTNTDLLSKCLYIRSLDEAEMNYCLEKTGE